MRAAKTVKEFAAGHGGKHDEDLDDPGLKLGRFLNQASPSPGTGPQSDSELKLAQ